MMVHNVNDLLVSQNVGEVVSQLFLYNNSRYVILYTILPIKSQHIYNIGTYHGCIKYLLLYLLPHNF